MTRRAPALAWTFGSAIGGRARAVGVLGLVLTTGSMACTEYVELQADADTFVSTALDIHRNDDYGCSHALRIGTGRGGDRQPEGAADAIRTLLRFDLEEVLDASSVRSATLELTISSFAQGARCSVYTIDAHRVLSSGDLTPWVEGNGYEGDHETTPPEGCAEPDAAYGVAWVGGLDPLNRQSATLGRNNDTQPKFDAGVIDTVVVDSRFHVRGDVLELDVTEVVDDWFWGRAPNHGLVLRDVTTDGDARPIEFGSREGEAAGNIMGPRLVLELGR